MTVVDATSAYAQALPAASRAEGGLGIGPAAAYFLAAAVVAALGAALPAGPQSNALVIVAYLAALPWLLAASTENLLVLTVLALPFDTWKVFGAVSATNVLITIAFARLLLERLRGERRLRPNVAYRPLAAVALVAVVSTAFAAERAAAARLLVSVFGAAAFALLIVNHATTPVIRRRLLAALFIASLLMGAAAVVQFVAYQLGWPLWEVYGDFWLYNLGIAQLKAAGLMSSPGNLAAYILPAIACGLSLWSAPMPQAQRRLLRVATGLCLIAAILTFTRATMLTVALLLMGVVVMRVSGRVRNPRLAAAVALVLLGAFGALAAPRIVAFLNGMNPGSTYSRLSIYLGALDSFRAHPLIGSGLGAQVHQNFGTAELYDLASSVNSKDLEKGFAPRDTHSTPLEIAVDMGLLGLLAYGWLFGGTLRRAVRALRSAASAERQLVGAVLAACLGTLFVLCFNDGIAMKPLWMMLGLSWALVPEALPRARPAEAAGQEGAGAGV